MLIFIVVKVALSKLQDFNAACTKAMGIAMRVFVKFRTSCFSRSAHIPHLQGSRKNETHTTQAEREREERRSC